MSFFNESLLLISREVTESKGSRVDWSKLFQGSIVIIIIIRYDLVEHLFMPGPPCTELINCNLDNPHNNPTILENSYVTNVKTKVM
jgi:hypothetical protein